MILLQIGTRSVLVYRENRKWIRNIKKTLYSDAATKYKD